MFLAGAGNLDTNKEYINELNVFPVPDGDTGTNMTMTILSAAHEVAALSKPDMASLAKAISSGSLRGARGNSGVILSQLFRGFTKTIAEHESIDASLLCAAFEKAVETAYKAVMKPKEGTILTVARGVSERTTQLVTENPDISLEELLPLVLAYGEEVLARTPDMLPVLKEAGVVDSGGTGLIVVLRGALDAFCGKETQAASFSAAPGPAASDGHSRSAAQPQVEEQDLTFGYCTEFIVMVDKDHPFTEKMEEEFKQYLMSLGDSLVLVADDDYVKVHVHTNHPGLAFEKGLTYGALTRMKVDNMREEHHERVIMNVNKILNGGQTEDKPGQPEDAPQEKPQPEKEVGFISVSIGDGIGEIFQDLGVDYLIEGGQTMNPSTEDMLNAIDQVPARTIFILPNNKNIILAANQAQSLTEDKKILVVPTTTIPQGLCAVINYVPDKTPEENLALMEEEISRVKTGQVTYAVRDTHIDDKTIHMGDFMGVGDHSILAVGKDLNNTAVETLAAMVDEDSELISIYFGEDISEEEAAVLSDTVQERFPDCEVELNMGGQPIYYYILSVE